MPVSYHLLCWRSDVARILLLGGGLWLLLLLGAMGALAPRTLLGVSVATGLILLLGVVPLAVALLRLRVPVRVEATDRGLLVRRDGRAPPYEGLVQWRGTRLVWSQREDGDNLSVEHGPRVRFLLSASDDDQLNRLRRDIEQRGVKLEVG